MAKATGTRPWSASPSILAQGQNPRGQTISTRAAKRSKFIEKSQDPKIPVGTTLWYCTVRNLSMATQIDPQAAHLDAPSSTSSSGSPLTKDYIRNAYKHLEETDDLDVRNEFWDKYMIENVTWEITGNGHSLAGIRHSLAEHSAASFSKLGNQRVPFRFVCRAGPR